MKQVADSVENTDGSLTTEWLDTKQAAAYLKVTVGALRNMTSNGHIPYYKLVGRNRYRTSELQSLLLSKKRGVNYGN
jgi:excisionase family DNA binding protein